MQQDGFTNDVWNFGLFLVEVLRPIVNQTAKTRATLFHLLHEYRESELDMASVFGMLTWNGLPEYAVVSQNTAESKEDLSDTSAAVGNQSSSMYMRSTPQVRAIPAVSQHGLYDQSPGAQQTTAEVSVNLSLSVSAESQPHSPVTAPSQVHNVDNRYSEHAEDDDGYSIDFEVKQEEVNEILEPYSWFVPCIIGDVPVLNHPFMEWLARWCTRIRPQDRPSMRMVACLIQTLARADGTAGGFTALPAMYLAFDQRSFATVDGSGKKGSTPVSNLLNVIDFRAAANASSRASVNPGPAIVNSAAVFDSPQALDSKGATVDTVVRQCMPMSMADWKFLSLVWTRAAGSSIEWCGAVMSEADRQVEPTHRVVNFAFNCIGEILQVRTV
jgi:hypothetical protein